LPPSTSFKVGDLQAMTRVTIDGADSCRHGRRPLKYSTLLAFDGTDKSLS
jgi:hypothetical protein